MGFASMFKKMVTIFTIEFSYHLRLFLILLFIIINLGRLVFKKVLHILIVSQGTIYNVRSIPNLIDCTIGILDFVEIKLY